MRRSRLTVRRLEAALLTAAAIALCGCSGNGERQESTEIPTSVSTSDTPREQTAPQTEPIISYSELLECRYYDESSFHIYDDRGEAYPTEGGVLCGVVPHHLTAGHMISGFFKAAAESGREIETVVIVAPLHYPSDNRLCTTEKGWATPYGMLETDTEITSLFSESLGAVCDDEMLQHDHSASSHIPFVKYYFPEARSACLLVSPTESGDITERLSELLAEISELKSCLFVFSIDFSHYLSPEEADICDSETLAAVLAGDTAAIEAMNNDNVDSPYCLSAYVRLSEALGGEISSADNSSSYEILDYPYNKALFPEGVTSYFVYITQ